MTIITQTPTQNKQLNMVKVYLKSAGLWADLQHAAEFPLDEPTTRRELHGLVNRLPRQSLITLFWVASLLYQDAQPVKMNLCRGPK